MSSTRCLKFVAIIGCWILSALGSANACSYPPSPTFEDIAPDAKHIFVFQILQLEYHQTREQGEWIEGTVRVVETFRGAPRFARVYFHNGWCGGNRLDVGRSYLMATDGAEDTLYFKPADRTVIDISIDYNPSWPSPVETSRILQRLLRALEGKASFKDVPPPDYYQLTSPIPGPPCLC